MLRWGANREEAFGPFPGADIIPDGRRGSTMAVNLDAPPSAVWPWLIQMGYDRAGWYSWDLLDHLGKPSARQLHPEWQAITVGKRLLATPNAKHWFEVVAAKKERFLALRTFTVMGRQTAPIFPRPRRFSDSLWAFQLQGLPGDRTRLVVSVYFAHRLGLPNALLGYFFWEPAHFFMQLRQFANLRRRVEGTPAEDRWTHPFKPAVPLTPGPRARA
jgi:proline iminopeptidase